MNDYATRLRVMAKRLRRPLIGVVVAYAVAAQSLLIALGGFALSANASDGAPGFELCQHDVQNVPELPVGGSKRPQCTHCIFCFGASHHGVVAARSIIFERLDLETIDASWPGDNRNLPGLRAHAIASPRGPPSAA
jgi:hypothetical protein